MSNNEDVVKVIATVAKITYEFFDNHPQSIVIIKPIDEKRKKLYSIVFQRHFKDILKTSTRFSILLLILVGEKKPIYPQKLTTVLNYP